MLRNIAPLDQWTEKEQTRAEVESVILDRVFLLPEPPCTPDDKDAMAKMLYGHVWQQSLGGSFGSDAPRTAWPLTRSQRGRVGTTVVLPLQARFAGLHQ